jgi:hypothetical protein
LESVSWGEGVNREAAVTQTPNPRNEANASSLWNHTRETRQCTSPAINISSGTVFRGHGLGNAKHWGNLVFDMPVCRMDLALVLNQENGFFHGLGLGENF